MPSLAPTLVPLGQCTEPVDPPGKCLRCGAEVLLTALDANRQIVLGEPRDGVIEVRLPIADLTVTAQPCGHVIHSWRKDEDD